LLIIKYILCQEILERWIKMVKNGDTKNADTSQFLGRTSV